MAKKSAASKKKKLTRVGAAISNGKSPLESTPKSDTSPDPPKHPGGRPPKYTTDFLPFVRELVKVGLTDAQLAVALRVSASVVAQWKRLHPEFLQVIKSEKLDANGKVRRSLFERACGYYHPDVVITNYKGMIYETEVMKHYPPDTTACIFWLKNRGSVDPDTGQEEVWKDKHHHVGDLRVKPLEFNINGKRDKEQIEGAIQDADNI